MVSVDELTLTPDPWGLNPYVYSSPASPRVTLAIGPNGVELDVSGVTVGIFADVTGNNPLAAMADFQVIATATPEPDAALLFGVGMLVFAVALRRDIGPLGPFAHLGVACASRDEIEQLCALAKSAGCLREEPRDTGGPAGFLAILDDPDGHTLELSYGQEVGLAVEQAT